MKTLDELILYCIKNNFGVLIFPQGTWSIKIRDGNKIICHYKFQTELDLPNILKSISEALSGYEKKEFERCETCDLDMNGDECNCWCKCRLPHSQCVCDMTEEDWKKYGEQTKE